MSCFVMIAKSLSESTASLYSTPLGPISLTGTRQTSARHLKEYTQIDSLPRRKARVHSGEKPADLYCGFFERRPSPSEIEKSCASFDIVRGQNRSSIQPPEGVMTRVFLSDEMLLT